jgi:hypothetical protein
MTIEHTRNRMQVTTARMVPYFVAGILNMTVFEAFSPFSPLYLYNPLNFLLLKIFAALATSVSVAWAFVVTFTVPIVIGFFILSLFNACFLSFSPRRTVAKILILISLWLIPFAMLLSSFFQSHEHVQDTLILLAGSASPGYQPELALMLVMCLIHLLLLWGTLVLCAWYASGNPLGAFFQRSQQMVE